MNFVNKLISRIVTLVTLVLVFTQCRIAYFEESHDVLVLVFSIVFLVLILFNLVYQIFLYVKYHKNYEKKFVGNDCSINLLAGSVALLFSVLDFVLAYAAYLYLI